ncbi:MAG: universal stress protein [Flavobacteriales bacterium]
MKNIIILVDYTEGCKLALQQALAVSKRSKAKMIALNIQKDGGATSEAFDKLKTFTMSAIGYQENVTALVHEGVLFQTISDVISDLHPDLVVFCTHGMKGLAQVLFGGHALKLVQSLPYPCLVVQENTKLNHDGFSKILFAASPYPDVMSKANQTAAIAQLFGAEVVVYEIDKYFADTEEAIATNNKLVSAYFNSCGVKHSFVKTDVTMRSLGFALQAIQYAEQNKMDMLTMMSHVQDEDMLMLKADKEKMIANEAGIPVLCCSHEYKPVYYEL